jgi:nicotinate-nucleotide adenylyltransferase
MARLTRSGLRIGVFGGTFDPPHIAHLVLADEARYQLNLDKVLWLLTPDPPHKRERTLTPANQRLTLLEAAIDKNPCFSVSKIDITRPPPQYAVDTMLILRKRHPRSKIFYIMGGDSLQDLPTWERPLEFVDQCEGLAVMRRPGAELDLDAINLLIPGISEKTIFLDAPLMNISASEIRERRNSGRPYRYYVPDRVFYLIQELNLYF